MRPLLFITSIVIVIAGFVACTSSRDPGIPSLTEDEIQDALNPEYGDEDAETETDGDQDSEELDLPPTRCATGTHNNGEKILAEAGGVIQHCLPGESIDGSSVAFRPGDLNSDAYITISESEDITADGHTALGPAVIFSARSDNGDVEVIMSQPAIYEIPLYPDDSGTDAVGVVVTEQAELLDASEAKINYDADSGMVQFEYDQFGIFQIVKIQ